MHRHNSLTEGPLLSFAADHIACFYILSDMAEGRTLGMHLATRLVELGVKDFFAVPGDYNLVLLDQLLKEPRLNMINTCNELSK